MGKKVIKNEEVQAEQPTYNRFQAYVLFELSTISRMALDALVKPNVQWTIDEWREFLTKNKFSFRN